MQGLVEYNNYYTAASTEQRAEKVRFCRIDKMFDKEKKRITFALAIDNDGQVARKLVLSALKEIGSTMKHGRAPRTNMERELQGWLDELLS